MTLLPEGMETEDIASMLPGDTGFTVAHAIMVGENREMWIRGDYTLYHSMTDKVPFGTTALIPILRTEHGIQIRYEDIKDQKYNITGGIDHAIRAWKALPVTLVE